MPKHVHFIGICGVAMGALALAFQKKGWKVTGSDKGFYPPVSTHLKDAGIEYYPGWHVEKMTESGNPDLVVVGNVAGSINPEWVHVQEHGLNYKSYPELISEFFVKENSIVCAGTYGKTSAASLLSYILTKAEYNPSYMFGGLTVNDMDSASLREGSWSVLEGDEYKTARWDISPKFKHYSPTHLLLSSVQWDHADIYKTEEAYKQAFKELLDMISPQGLVIACSDDKNVLKLTNNSHPNIIYYGKNENYASDRNYSFNNIKETKNGLKFVIKNKDKTYNANTPMLGAYQAANITGAFAMAHEIGIAPDNIIQSIHEFKGIKRRLEKRSVGTITVFDDIAHSPTKAQSVLKTLKAIYSGKIIGIFEPNTGNRKQESIPSYNHAFKNADEIIIPRLTKLKTKLNEVDKHFEGEELKEVISKTHGNCQYIPNDDELVEYIIKNTKKDDAVVFMGSHGFRGMIESLTEKIS